MDAPYCEEMPDTILLTNDPEKRWEYLARCLHRIETRQVETVRTTDNLAAEIRSLLSMQKNDHADLLALVQRTKQLEDQHLKQNAFLQAIAWLVGTLWAFALGVAAFFGLANSKN